VTGRHVPSPSVTVFFEWYIGTDEWGARPGPAATPSRAVEQALWSGIAGDYLNVVGLADHNALGLGAVGFLFPPLDSAFGPGPGRQAPNRPALAPALRRTRDPDFMGLFSLPQPASVAATWRSISARANTLVLRNGRGAGSCFSEPSVVAIDQRTGEVHAGRHRGQAACSAALLHHHGHSGRSRDGVIADFDVTEEMLRHFIQKGAPETAGAQSARGGLRAQAGVDRRGEKRRRGRRDPASSRCGARKRLPSLEEPMARRPTSALGLPVGEARPASMVVDIGGGTSDGGGHQMQPRRQKSSSSREFPIRVAANEPRRGDHQLLNRQAASTSCSFGQQDSGGGSSWRSASAYPMEDEVQAENPGPATWSAPCPRRSSLTRRGDPRGRRSRKPFYAESSTRVKETLDRTPPEGSQATSWIAASCFAGGGIAPAGPRTERLREGDAGCPTPPGGVTAGRA